MFVSLLYLFLFLLSVVALFILFPVMSNRHGSYYSLLFTLITIVCLAYFSYSISVDEGMALVSNQFTYLDGTFIMMLFIFCIMDIVGVKIRPAVGISWTILSILVLLIPFTAGHNDLFYKSYTLAQRYGASYLEIEFGPLHTPFMIYIIINMLLPVLVVIVSFFFKKKISYKVSIELSALLAAILLLYFIQQYLNAGFDLLPIGYVLIEYVVLVIIKRTGLYDVNKIALTASESDKDYGCIVLDTQKHFIGANDTAKYYFPELSELSIDVEITNELIKTEFVDWLNMHDTKEASVSKIISRNDRKILCTARDYVKDNNKKTYGYVIVLRDDTAQQNLIEELNQTNEELAGAALIADNASKAKSQFLASMSHEIRTPINAILGMNELALRNCKDDDISEYLHNIETAGHALMGIINDILDFSKIEAGKIEIINDDYKTTSVLNEIENMIAVKANQKNLNLIVEAASDIPSTLYGDEKRIRQIMINLLNNAVKYTPEGSITLNVSTESISDKSCNLIIKVKDTGIGIKKENLDSLFESFSRLEEKRNKNIEGTGLGLAITLNLVNLMNGHIEVDSVYGEGSTFTVTLPQFITDKTPIGNYKEINKNTDQDREIVNVDATGKNILVVDDNFINLKISEGLLMPTNANITICDNGPEALRLMSEKHYDIILLDHMMPEMDGIEVLQRAKRDIDSCKNSSFIVFTANAINGACNEYKAAGFNDYLSKPIDPALFIRTIAKYL